MRLAILHLSDIHIHGTSDKVLSKADQIASSFFTEVRASDAALILVTGDIAYSGKEIEYEAAIPFLKRIQELVAAESQSIVTDIICVPGNHDCELIPEVKARTILVDHVANNPDSEIDVTVIDTCTDAQSAYFKFRDHVTASKAINDHKLWTEYELQIAGKNIRISAINASWMSKMPEKPGQLVFPVHLFNDLLSEPSNLRIAMVHHPLNWYAQASYHPLRNALRSRADVLLSGHEHAIGSGEVIDGREGRSLYFEAPALQSHESSPNLEYSIVSLDVDTNRATHS